MKRTPYPDLNIAYYTARAHQMRAEAIAAFIDRLAERIKRAADRVVRWSNQHPALS